MHPARPAAEIELSADTVEAAHDVTPNEGRRLPRALYKAAARMFDIPAFSRNEWNLDDAYEADTFVQELQTALRYLSESEVLSLLRGMRLRADIHDRIRTFFASHRVHSPDSLGVAVWSLRSQRCEATTMRGYEEARERDQVLRDEDTDERVSHAPTPRVIVEKSDSPGVFGYIMRRLHETLGQRWGF